MSFNCDCICINVISEFMLMYSVFSSNLLFNRMQTFLKSFCSLYWLQFHLINILSWDSLVYFTIYIITPASAQLRRSPSRAYLWPFPWPRAVTSSPSRVKGHWGFHVSWPGHLTSGSTSSTSQFKRAIPCLPQPRRFVV